MNQFDFKRIDVVIKWSKPYSIDEASELSEDLCSDTYFYKIIGKHGERYKLFYIGKCVKQFFTKRIFQRDHLAKRADFKEAYSKHRIMVSLGDVDFDNNKYYEEHVDNIERLLIYSHSHDGFPHMKNKMCTLNHNVVNNYLIKNRGWRGEGMYKNLGYGLFVEG